MGPLPFSSGNRPGAKGAKAPRAGFNGAAAFQQRKSDPEKKTGLKYIASMGPLPFSSGNR